MGEWKDKELRWIRIQIAVFGGLILLVLAAMLSLIQFSNIGENVTALSLLAVVCALMAFGLISGIVALNHILHRSRRAQRALRESEERWRSLVESAPDLILNVDRDGVILFINRTEFGYTREQVLGAKVYDFLPEPEVSRYREALERVFHTKKAERYELEWRAPDGQLVWFSCSMGPIEDESGVVGATVVVRNVTQRKHSEIALRQQQEYLRKVIDTDPSLVFAKDWNGRFTLVNQAVAEIYGTTVEKLIGKTDADFNPNAKEVAHFLQDDREVMSSGIEKFIVEEPVTNPKTKSTSWFQTIKRPLILGEGQLPQVLGVASDITARKKAEEELRRSEEQFRTLANNVPGVVYLCRNDARYSMLFLSDAVETLTGVPAKEFLEDRISFVDLYHPEDAPFIPLEVDRAVAAKRPFKLAYRILHKSGEWRWVEEHGQGVFDEKGELRFLEGTLLDVTEIKKAEEERRKFEASIQQAQKLESLGVLAGGIAHDFNNLLMGILGNAGLALMELPSHSPGRRSVQHIETAALRAAELTRQLLAYSGKGKFMTEVIHVSKLVEETAHLLKSLISTKATLEFHFEKDLPCIEADPSQIRQIVMNLITNASDAIEGDSGMVKIRTGTMMVDRDFLNEIHGAEELSEGKYVYIEVSDTGVGMSEETLAKIFDPFFTTKFTGRGLGLAAVMGIVRGHLGCIKVDSKQGKGTTFRVLLPPTDKPETLPLLPTEKDKNWRGAGTVLVVDDEIPVCSVARAMLEQFGFQVLTAHNGFEAVELFKTNQDSIVLVLLDLTMPRMSGEQTFLELRKLRDDIPVLLSSGYNEQEFTEKLQGHRLSGFIQKPYQPMSLIEKVRSIVDAQTIQPAAPRSPEANEAVRHVERKIER